MPDQKVATLLRLRPGLKEKLAQLAKREHRSLNQQIEFMLESLLSKADIVESENQKENLQSKARKNS